MNAHLVALRDEIDARLAEVEQTSGSCPGHPALARALGTLLRCQRAQTSILPRAAAEILGVHRRTLQRYERAGLLPPIRLSTQKIRYDAGEVERLAERGMDTAVTA